MCVQVVPKVQGAIPKREKKKKEPMGACTGWLADAFGWGDKVGLSCMRLAGPRCLPLRRPCVPRPAAAAHPEPNPVPLLPIAPFCAGVGESFAFLAKNPYIRDLAFLVRISQRVA